VINVISALFQDSYTPIVALDDPAQIAALVAALDTELPLRPHARCPAAYQLRFTPANGQHHDFGYACATATTALLRDGQDFWGGQDAVAPEGFRGLIRPLLGPDESFGSQEA
jgi:hypothetical protein